MLGTVSIRNVIKTLGSVPWLFPVALYSFVWRARLTLGEWPEPYRPDPKVLGFEFHRFAVLGALLFGMAGTFVLGLVALWILIRQRGQHRLLVAAFVSYVVFWIVIYGDPGSFWEWFLD